MVVISGRKQVERKLGYVADFCPICRDINPFLISRMGVANHIYYLPLGEGKLTGHLAECQKCKTRIPTNPAKYKTFMLMAGNEIEELILQTYPNLRTDYSERLSLEEAIKNHQIFSPTEREALLMEPFGYLANRVEERYANARFDKESGWGCFGTILLAIILSCMSSVVSESGLAHNATLIAMGLTACIGLIYTVIQLILAPDRFVQREITPLLASALHPLSPNPQEITQCLYHCKARGFRIGNKISDEKLWKAIQQIH